MDKKNKKERKIVNYMVSISMNLNDSKIECSYVTECFLMDVPISRSVFIFIELMNLILYLRNLNKYVCVASWGFISDSHFSLQKN